MYVVIDLKTGHVIERTSTLRRAQERVEALLQTWVWTEGQLSINLAA